MNRRTALLSVSLLLAASHVGRRASAADTVETWDAGATDVDFYVGYEGIGLGKKDRAVFGDMMLGYGIVDRFSAYLGTTLQGNDGFAEGSATHYLGVFGTPLDTSHFDMDVFLDFSEGGPAQTFQLRPALELNFDGDADTQTWGVYFRAPLPIYGRKLSPPLHPERASSEVTFHLESALGTYFTLSRGHQLLLELDAGYHPDPAPDERQKDIGGVALGYNVVLTEGLELINQVAGDIPQDREEWSIAVMTGFIATIPSRGR